MPERWPGLLSKNEAAEYLGVSPKTIGRMKALGQIRSVSLRGKILYRRSELDAFIDELPYGDGNCPADSADLPEDLQAKPKPSRRPRTTAVRAGGGQ